MGGGIDWGHANFADSAGARNVVAGLNPMSPGGMSPKGTHLPTLAWAVIFAAVLILLFNVVKKSR